MYGSGDAEVWIGDPGFLSFTPPNLSPLLVLGLKVAVFVVVGFEPKTAESQFDERGSRTTQTI